MRAWWLLGMLGCSAWAPTADADDPPVCSMEDADLGRCVGLSDEPIPAGKGDGATNVLGGSLAVCGTDPVTGWFRDGHCRTDASDRGVHVVCARVDDGFLAYTKAAGNDLSTPRGGFPGLSDGDRWCLCAARWEEARRAGHAPAVVLEATNAAALQTLSLGALKTSAVRSR